MTDAFVNWGNDPWVPVGSSAAGITIGNATL